MVWDVRRGRRAGSVPESLAGPVVGERGGRSVILESRKGGSAAVAALPSGTPRTRLRGRFSSPYSLGGAFTGDGTVLATEDDTRTELWDTHSGRRLGTLPGANTLPSPDAFSPTGEWLLNGPAPACARGTPRGAARSPTCRTRGPWEARSSARTAGS